MFSLVQSCGRYSVLWKISSTVYTISTVEDVQFSTAGDTLNTVKIFTTLEDVQYCGVCLVLGRMSTTVEEYLFSVKDIQYCVRISSGTMDIDTN